MSMSRRLLRVLGVPFALGLALGVGGCEGGLGVGPDVQDWDWTSPTPAADDLDPTGTMRPIPPIDPPVPVECTPFETTMLACEGFETGRVGIIDNDAELTLGLRSTDGWLYKKVWVWAGDALPPTTWNGAPNPSAYPIYESFVDDPVESVSLTIPLDEVEAADAVTCGDPLVLAVKAKMTRPEAEENDAWHDGWGDWDEWDDDDDGWVMNELGLAIEDFYCEEPDPWETTASWAYGEPFDGYCGYWVGYAVTCNPACAP